MNNTNINWFPGHMAKAIREIETKLKVIDVVLEIIDARIPLSSANPVIDNLCKNKYKIVLMNKIDLADDNITKLWGKYFLAKNIPVILINAKSEKIRNKVNLEIKKIMAQKIEKYKNKGLINYRIKAMILGIPNVGKSTIINNIIAKKSVKVGNKPGVTRGQQWLRIDKKIDLLDTPGILWPKINDQSTGIKLALVGSIRPDILDKEQLVYDGIDYLLKNYRGLFKDKYFSDLEELPIYEKSYFYVKLLEKKYKANREKVINILFNDFINNKLGKISWEKYNEN